MHNQRWWENIFMTDNNSKFIKKNVLFGAHGLRFYGSLINYYLGVVFLAYGTGNLTLLEIFTVTKGIARQRNKRKNKKRADLNETWIYITIISFDKHIRIRVRFFITSPCTSSKIDGCVSWCSAIC